MTRRVLVVEDSPVFSRILSAALRTIPEVEVVGVARSAEQALRLLPQREPDLITLDILMPDESGIDLLRRLKADRPALKVLMVSSLTKRGAVETVQSLQLGASDYLLKPVVTGDPAAGLRALAAGLHAKITALLPLDEPLTLPALARRDPPAAIDVVAIAASTGGPAALAELLPELPADFPLGVVVVQHILPEFTQHLVTSLEKRCKLPVSAIARGEPLRPRRIYLAGSGAHTVVTGSATAPRFEADFSPPLHGCRPAADMLFGSLASVFGDGVLAIVLTGTGADGTAGSEQVRAAGGWVTVQDPRSSTARSMPASVIQAGHADEVLPLARIAPRVIELSGGWGQAS